MNRSVFLLLLSGLIGTIETSCFNPNRPAQDSVYLVSLNKGTFSYDLFHPDETYNLPNDLLEISGLTYFDQDQLACLQDEDGDVYIYDLPSKEVIQVVDFGKGGDYEGVEFVNNIFYMIKSNGDLYYFHYDKSNKVKSEEVELPLNSDNNVEGLGFLPQKNLLLIACKGKAGFGKEAEKIRGRAIYAFDRKKMEMNQKPWLIVDHDLIEQQLEQQNFSKIKHLPFKPSGVAVHPIDEKVYIIASVGKLLMIFTQEGEFDEIVPLPPKYFNQPEGICFNPQGDLFISNEGIDHGGNILKFEYQKK
ncbi:MAG: SdiA-regulated domain-containing protein [Candidatus Cyclobacteriaceae bacterium M3_2C_046]